MSYRRAWLLVDMMNRCFVSPVVDAETGGPRGGGTRLTLLGEELMRRYRRIEAAADAGECRRSRRADAPAALCAAPRAEPFAAGSPSRNS